MSPERYRHPRRDHRPADRRRRPPCGCDRAGARRARPAPRRRCSRRATSTRAATRAGTSASSIRRSRWSRAGATFRVEALNARGRVLLPARSRAALGRARRPSRSSSTDDAARRAARSASRRAASPRRSAAASRRSSRSCARSSTCSARADDPHLGLYGAFGYDLAFQFEPLRLRLERPARPARPGALPARRAARRRPPARARDAAAATTSSVDGRLDRRAAARAARAAPFAGAPTRRPRRATTRPASTPRVVARRAGGLPARRPVRGRARPDVLRAAARRRPSELFRRLRERNPSPYGFLINLGERRVPGRRLAGDVRARRRRPRRDLPDLRHDRARRATRSRDAAQILRAAQLDEGRVRADDVHRRRSQRQVAHLRARQRARDRPPPDRDVLAPDPHRRPRRGAAAPRLRRPRRVPHAHLGGDRDRRAEGVGDAVHRGPRDARRAPGTAAPSA